jgi:transcriptional regulator with GAF, ATPase, and Fis domain
MSTELVGASKQKAESNQENHHSNGQESLAGSSPLHLRIAQPPARNRVQLLLNLAGSLLRETESLAREKAFTEEYNRLQALTLAEGIDFYDEVQRFETGLIRMALDQTHGHQARAARLLHIKPTTLNSKIKLYGIEY